MALALRLLSRNCSFGSRTGSYLLQGPLSPQWSRTVYMTPVAGAMKVESAEDYWVKNQRLRRPVSPHLTIYKPQLTSLLSLTHRATGITLGVLVSGFSIGMLILPESFPYYLQCIQSLHFGSGLIFFAKFSLALPFMYHLCNGVRHLVWDLGYGFTLRTLYKTGYFVLAISVVLSVIAAAM